MSMRGCAAAWFARHAAWRTRFTLYQKGASLKGLTPPAGGESSGLREGDAPLKGGGP